MGLRRELRLLEARGLAAPAGALVPIGDPACCPFWPDKNACRMSSSVSINVPDRSTGAAGQAAKRGRADGWLDQSAGPFDRVAGFSWFGHDSCPSCRWRDHCRLRNVVVGLVFPRISQILIEKGHVGAGHVAKMEFSFETSPTSRRNYLDLEGLGQTCRGVFGSDRHVGI